MLLVKHSLLGKSVAIVAIAISFVAAQDRGTKTDPSTQPTIPRVNGWPSPDGRRLFVPSQPIVETIVRGTCMYLAVFGLLRLFRRQTGSLGPADLLVLLLVADAAQNGMAGEYTSITDGIILVITIISWEYFLDWLGFRSRWIQRLLERTPLLLIKDGIVQSENLQRELMTLDDLHAQLRRKGVEGPEQVKRCFLEGDGHVSVVTFRDNPQAPHDDDERR
jgi:uncharacterized membrane protein YcaP (DUF421 family)